MSSINAISSDKLARLIGVSHCPALIDVRTDEEWGSEPRFIPGALLPCALTWKLAVTSPSPAGLSEGVLLAIAV